MGKAEAVKVVVRCRPFNSREKKLKSKNIVYLGLKTGGVELTNPKSGGKKKFTFDRCYGEDTRQEDFYNDTPRTLVESVIEGYNGTMFAYGQTGSGKTFTMAGVPKDETLKGVSPRAMEHIFNAIGTQV